MRKYRLLEIRNPLINDGKPFWKVEKKTFLFGWTDYFEQHTLDSATFYNKEEAERWFDYHANRIREEVIVLKAN